MYKAHINEETHEIQTVKEHAENVAKLCRDFAIPKMQGLLYTTGLLHDIGKYQPSFQKRIDGADIRVEHSTCGAIVAKELYPDAAGLMMSYCIAGHHAGIPDGGFRDHAADPDHKSTLQARLVRTFEDYSAYKNELDIPVTDAQDFLELLIQDCGTRLDRMIDKFAFFTRYAFSCLTDADSLDTAKFCGNSVEGHLSSDFQKCLEKVNTRLSSFTCATALQKSRMLLQSQVFEKVGEAAEIYLMNMPTGSGKTLCSIKFALERAIRAGYKRIIYIIPYNSIIDQTAAEFDSMFGEDAKILRHQSTFSYEEDSDWDEDDKKIAKNAAENWDADFIITTAVQFFESIYSNKRGKLRKLHNMADSVLIFDEAHMMPQNYLQPCLQAVMYISRYLHSESVFLTATMPDFSKLIGQYALPNGKIRNLVGDTTPFAAFSKCRYQYIGAIDMEEIVRRAAEYPSCLVIVNKKKDAEEVYRAAAGKKYHLSTYMTSVDRKRVLDTVRKELAQLEEDFPGLAEVPKERRIFVVSTSLVEAGVDLDFYTVFRERFGLDSILQAGGRCNREGKRECADVFVFDFQKETTGVSQDERANLTKGLLEKYADISCAESIREYYDRLFFLKKDNIQAHTISRDAKRLQSIPFREYAQNFELMDTKTVSLVVVQDKESGKLVESLKYAGMANMRKLQKYTCSVYQRELDDLRRQHVVDDFHTGVWCLTNHDYYDKDTGILFEAKDYFI